MSLLLTRKLRRRCLLAAAIALLTVGSDETGLAQGQPPGPAPQKPAGGAQPQTPPAPPSMPRIVVTAGRSTVVTTEFDVIRIAITNPAVAEATVVTPREILIDGKAPGTISLIIWGASHRTQSDIVVEQPVAALQQQLQALFPGENIQVTTNEDATVLSGTVSSTNVMLRAAEIAAATAAKRKIINMLQVPGGSESQQVLLQVRFAEVNRRALRELGVSLFTSGNGLWDTWGRTTTQQFAAPAFTDLKSTKVDGEIAEQSGELTFSDFLNIFFLNAKHDFGAVIRALQSSGQFHSLAEPNLIAYNGQEASFLAGGEFPVPVVQGATGTVTVEFKEFGIRLTFTPLIAGDMIRLKVMPEVSTLDFANGVTLGGFRIPALTTRRAQTDVELRDGQSFAIAGLLDNQAQDDMAGIPLLSKLPIIGYLFRSKAERSQQTELMVLITPRLVRALNPDEVPPLPTKFKSFVPQGGVGTGMDGAGLVDAPAAEHGAAARQTKPGKGRK
jgi:pilus assembly protein CpaC